jgi:hypothetical protein
MEHPSASGKASRESGSSLLEVLIAVAILMILMVGVLSMFSMAYLMNLGSAARTEMTYKAQQVSDVIRYLNLIQRSAPASLPASTDTGLTFPLTAGTPVTITALSGSNLLYPYWGSPTSTLLDAAGIVDPGDMPYDITVGIAGPDAAGVVTVSVAVVPNTAATNPSGQRYIGKNMKWKEVDYVTQLPP